MQFSRTLYKLYSTYSDSENTPLQMKNDFITVYRLKYYNTHLLIPGLKVDSVLQRKKSKVFI